MVMAKGDIPRRGLCSSNWSSKYWNQTPVWEVWSWLGPDDSFMNFIGRDLRPPIVGIENEKSNPICFQLFPIWTVTIFNVGGFWSQSVRAPFDPTSSCLAGNLNLSHCRHWFMMDNLTFSQRNTCGSETQRFGSEGQDEDIILPTTRWPHANVSRYMLAHVLPLKVLLYDDHIHQISIMLNQSTVLKSVRVWGIHGPSLLTC